MADFPAITHTTLVSLFSDIANAIRAKKGTSADIVADNFPSEIASIPSGGAVTPEDKTYSISNQAIEEFVENVNYTADYSTSSVGTYTAKPYADSGRAKGANVNVKGGTLHQLDNGNDYTKTVAEGAITIYNNTPDTVGAYSVVNGGNVVSYGKLTPSGNVRIIKCDGIVNMRDLGGWAADGGTVRYGKLFRSPAIDNATTADMSMMSNLLGINSELDMRESGAEGGGSGRFDNYLHQPTGNYADIIATDAYKAKSKTAFEFVMNCAIQGNPCVFHCAAGADRTGTMAWVLLGVLGVSQSDCDKEYEITSFAGPTRLRSTYLGALYNAVNALDGDDFTNKCKNALISCGISIALINQFRHAMIDGVPTDFEDTAGMREEILASLKACTRMKWSNSTTSSKAPTNNNGWLALATTSGDTWQFTDRESNTCYGIKIPSWATKIIVSTTDASIIKWSFRSYLADGTAVGTADEDNTSGKYAVSNAEVIQISACYSTGGSVTPSWNYDSTKISVKFVGYGGITDVKWHQCPQLVRDYLANVTYNPSDYSTSQIANYAPATAVASNTKPIGKTVDGVTYYNEVPNVTTPFSSTSEAGTLKPLDRLRWINTPNAPNARDLGGWSCDGGTVKYGLLFRGGQPTVADRNVLVKECGVRVDLDLRSTDTHDTGSPQNGGITESPLGADIKYVVAPNYNWYKLYSSYAETTESWGINLRCIFDNAGKGIPVYFHCSAGADRTGTLACVIEGLLGMSQSDIDKDYELTCFYSGTGTDSNARRRNETEWKGLITAINALSGSTFRDKCVNFVASLGFTADEINAFRSAMIDGTPSAVTPSISTFSVTNTLSHVTSDNASAMATQYQPYEANIIPDANYKFDSVALIMGSTNIKASCYTEETYPVYKGKIKIPKVTGNIALTASAIMPIPTYTNQIPISTDTDGSIYNTIGYKTSTRINSSGNTVDASASYYAGACATGFIPVKKGDIIRFKNCVINSTHAQAGSFNVSQYDADKTRLTNGGTASWLQFTEAHATSFSYWWQDMQFDDSGNVVQFQLANNDVKFIRFTALNITPSSVITVNEVIE